MSSTLPLDLDLIAPRRHVPSSARAIPEAVPRWLLMVAALSGLPVPSPPSSPGRRVRPLGEIPKEDPLAEQWDADHQRVNERPKA
jgi:hypothetical protein